MSESKTYTKLEEQLAELSEIQEVVRSAYNSMRWDYAYEFERKEDYEKRINEGDDESANQAYKNLRACEQRIKTYEKIFDYLNTLLTGKV